MKHNTEPDKGTNCTSQTEGDALRRPCVAGLMALQTSQKQLTSLTKDSANALRVHATEAEVTHRLSNAKEAASRPAALESHEDLAKKLHVMFFLVLGIWQ
ncbi:hypothetical protein DCAR_0519129 [Daucus carota subsp. sativus]|uniref:Uncharacterized protein n=1 Tax=Daucus carota subsp. sativus TaxID=79200 RepID=A0A164XQV1_DAUCS|nr:hypothetical protein DCAR_0519129 [Daucus carota subsp. sativus]